MTMFITGILSALFFVMAVIVGAAVGWVLRGKWQRYTRKTLQQEISEQEELERQQEEAAFQAMLHYNVENVYGEGGTKE